MPRTLVALLRGINVGRAKRVAMADLRALVEDLGYHDVRTLLNSGNVVFTESKGARSDPGSAIEAALVAKLGVAARVTVLSASDLAAIVAKNPLHDIASDPARLLVAVLADPADRSRLLPLERQDWGAEKLVVGTRVAYLWCADGVIASGLVKAVNRALGDAVTMRNWATMTKLGALAAGE